MTKVNEKFPAFELEVYYPKTQKTGKLRNADLARKWAVVFYYPADFTFVCPTELADLAKRYKEFSKFGCEVYALSTDTVYTHKVWLETEHLLKGITYPMAADHNGRLAKELRVYDELTGMAQRSVFILNPKGIIKALMVVDDNIGRSAGEILRQLKALQFIAENPGLACPASWDTGDKTLKPDVAISGRVYEALKSHKR